MHSLFQRLFAVVVIGCLSMTAMAVERIKWEEAPITVAVSSETEREVEFPESVKIGLPRGLVDKFHTFQYVDNRLFIQPSEKLPPNAKVIARGVSGVNYVVRLDWVKNQNLDPKVVIHRSANSGSRSSQKLSGEPHGAREPRHAINSYPFLIRFVMQQVYAPERLIRTPGGITRVSVSPENVALFHCSPESGLCRSARSRPIVSFKTDRLYVTAFEIENVMNESVEIDPRLVRTRNVSQLLAASPMQWRLLPAAHGLENSTVMAVVHKHRFEDTFLSAKEAMGGDR